MTSRDFCYWLQGYFEITRKPSEGGALTAEQAECIKRHLAMVFVHEIDPSFPKEQQPGLDAAHAAPATGHPIGGVGPNGMLYRC